MTRPRRQPIAYLQGETVEVAPRDTLPPTSFVSIEFPAILTEAPFPVDGGEEHPSLVKALESLSPLPAHYTSAASALAHIGRSVGQSPHGRVIECKLAQACDPNIVPGEAPPIHPRTSNRIFRHALMGDIVDTHNIVCKVTKRVWRRTRANGEEEVRKEYTAHALGVTRHVARFRAMPDFAYDPGSMVDPPYANEDEVAPSIALHDALRQMDVEGIRSFELREEREEYELDDSTSEHHRARRSNLRMPPPVVFAKTDAAHSYGFRQNPSSHLVPVGGPSSTGGVQPMRFINRQGYRELAPIPFSMLSASSKRKSVPSGPMDAVKSHSVGMPDIVERLKELVRDRPMWTRRALFNQFKGEQRRTLQNQRHIISSVFYTVTDGCWRDNLVRFGYDPRKDTGARLYQRMSFQRHVKANAIQAGSATALHSPTIERMSASPGLVAAPQEEEDGRSHIFDGITAKEFGGNFLLIDIEDEVTRELIYATGDGVISTELHPTSGWYTPAHYNKIRAVLDHRMTVLALTGQPATHESCDAVIEGRLAAGTLPPQS